MMVVMWPIEVGIRRRWYRSF